VRVGSGIFLKIPPGIRFGGEGRIGKEKITLANSG